MACVQVATAVARRARTSTLIVKSASVRIQIILENKKGSGIVTQLRLTALT